MHLRSVVPSDSPLVARHRYPDAPDAELRVHYADWLSGALERGSYLGWVIEIEARVRAGAGLMLLEWGPTRTSSSPYRGRIVNVFTEPDSRNQGLASLLVKRCMEEAEKRGISEVGLSSSESARPLYSKLGFRLADSEMSLTVEGEENA